MGLDAVELVMNFEREFDIAILPDDYGTLRTAGDMCDFITKQKQAQSQCLHPAAFVRIRRALIEACGVARRRDRCGPEETAASKVRAMILADASLVALAEARRLRDIFTLDHADFTVYRLHRRRTFRLWPRVL